MASEEKAAAQRLDTLRTVLNAAHELAAELAREPVLDRALRAVMALPASDRETVVGVLERDATWCGIVRETASTTGITVRPNPHASLYVHVVDQRTPPEPLARDAEVIGLGIARFVRYLPLLFQEGVHAQWLPAAREFVRSSDPELRAFAARLAREVLALIAEAEEEGEGKG
jgi:hypothetical protein